MKLYVFVREDLSGSQQAVQSGHAVAEWLLRSPDRHKWHNGTLVYCGISNESSLDHTMWKLESKGESVISFEEPDIGNQKTSFACLGKNPRNFKGYRLLSL